MIPGEMFIKDGEIEFNRGAQDRRAFRDQYR